MPSGVAVTLPHGVRVGSEWTRDVRLRSVTGDEEVYVTDEAADILPAERTTGLLARCVERIGPAEASAEAVLALTVGDREALLLHIRRHTFGDRLDAVLTCPASDCGERMDLELRVGDLLVDAYAANHEWHEATIVEGDAQFDVRYRVPTGADQEVAARLASDLPHATATILERCVDEVSDRAGRRLDHIPDPVAKALPGLMASHDPQAEIVLLLVCPECATEFRVLFDAGAYLARELASRRDGVHEDVHHLALHYHWSESEILSMPTGKRRRYLELLADALGGRSR
jgi:hypothetical protein